MIRIARLPGLILPGSLFLLLLLLPACSATAINSDAQTTFLSADDLTQMTDKMAAAIASDSQVATILQSTGKPMVIVLAPVENQTNEVLRGEQKRMYVLRVRVLLSSKQVLRNQFTFVLNKKDYDQLMAQEGVSSAQLGPSQERIQPDYVLTGTFYADTKDNREHRSDYYLCTYRLTRITPNGMAGEIIWENKYETKKAVAKGFLD